MSKESSARNFGERYTFVNRNETHSTFEDTYAVSDARGVHRGGKVIRVPKGRTKR